VGKRVGGSACGRVGGELTPKQRFVLRTLPVGYELSKHAATPIRPPADTFPLRSSCVLAFLSA